MDLNQLRAKGAFVKAPPVPTQVTWTHDDSETGETVTDEFTVHVLRMSCGWLDRVFAAGRDPDRSRTATLIAEAIRFGVDGQESMTYPQAYQLDFGLASALLEAFNTVNRKGEAASPKP